MHNRTHARLLGLALTTLSGCFPALKDHRHHVILSAHGAPQPQSETPQAAGRVIVRVRDFELASVYDRGQLVERQSDTEVQFLRNQVWAARPGRMAADAVARHWARLRPDWTLLRGSTELAYPLTVSGEVSMLEVDATHERPSAHLMWSLRLTDSRTGELWHEARFDAHEPVNPQEGSNAAVAALDRLIARAAQEAQEAFSAHLPPHQR